jgi:hypothetical protein
MRRWYLLAVGLGLLGVGCAHSDREARGAWDELERDPAGFVRRVAELRQLPNRRPARIEFDDTEPFLALVRGKLAERRGVPSASDLLEYYVAFNFFLPGQGNASTPEEIQREQILAFYDERTHTIHVRRPDASSDPEPGWVFAHEVAHSLQHQNFRIPELAEIVDDDTRLAEQALLEGDAMVTALGFIASEAHVPLGRALLEATRRIQRGDLGAAIEASGSSTALLHAPAILRERIVFPYLAGTTFVGAVYRAGGFGLVDRLFSRPPTTTEQVLYPAKYLGGEEAMRVRPPTAPPGYRVLETGRLGELQTRVMLAGCLPLGQASSGARGWGGDAFALVRSADAHVGLLWSTVWDTPEDAVRFEQAMRKVAGCWPAVSPAGPGEVIQGQALVERRGSAVAVSRGLVRGAESLPALLSLSEPGQPARPPLGQVVLRPPRPRVPARAPHISGQRYVDERLGIELPVPPGFIPQLMPDELLVTREGPSRALASVMLSRWVVDRPALEELFRKYVEAVRDTIGKANVRLASSGMAMTPLGRAVERVYELDGGVTLRLLVLPICGMTGSVLVSQLWRDEATRSELGRWLGGLRSLGAGPPPICAELDP